MGMKYYLFILYFSILGCTAQHEGDFSTSTKHNQLDSTRNVVDTIIQKNTIGDQKFNQVKQIIQQFIENKIPDKKYEVRGRILHSSEVLLNIYAQKLYTPLWLNGVNDTLVKVEQMLTFIDSVKYHGLNPNDYHIEQLKKLHNSIFSVGLKHASPLEFAHLDLLLTDAFLSLASHLYNGKFNPYSLKIQYGIQQGKPELLMDYKLFKMLAHDNINRFMTVFYPKAHGYIKMVEKAKQLDANLDKDFKISLSANYDFSKLFSDTIAMTQIAKKMKLLGYACVIDTFIHDSLARNAVIKKFQYHHGLNQDGEFGKRTFEALNTSIEDRLYQIYINMERIRWLPEKYDQFRVVVNIADYTMDLIDGMDTLLHMKTIIGRSVRETPVFSSKMTYLVFSPTWTVPPGILRKDILPAVAKDVNYLARKNMVVLNRSNEIINPDSIDWVKARRGSFPYIIRQQPGDHNALGRVKFMFPNKYSVYLHDTPSKSLFNRDERLFSSGCIRIEKPIDLAKALLNDSINWGDEQILESMALTEEKVVSLKRPVRVYIYYLTAWEGDHFRKDVYGRDQNKKHLFRIKYN
jgi:murein L,D-transpeptidase YcbB/YkuD